MTPPSEVLDFIKRRFPKDSNWTDGNCYYFAIILLARFPNAVIYYDTLKGHFFATIDSVPYDWNGIIVEDNIEYFKKYCIRWDKMQDYDSLVCERVTRDCIY